MTDETVGRVLEHLNGEPVDGAELARRIGLPITDEALYHFRIVRNAKREIQRDVHELRKRGHKIESDERGYWLAPKPKGQESLFGSLD